LVSEVEQRKYIPWTPEKGFDFSFLTIKRVAEVTGESPHAIKKNVVNLLKVLPVEERALVMEHIAETKQKRWRKLPNVTSP